jgi:ABC transporter
MMELHDGINDGAMHSEDEYKSSMKSDDSHRLQRPSHTLSMMRASQLALAKVAISTLDTFSDVHEDEAVVQSTNMVVTMDENGEVYETPMSERETKLRHLHRRLSVYQDRVPERLVEVRLKSFSYYVPVNADAPTIKTVGNQSICYAAYEFFRRIHQYRLYRQESSRTVAANTPSRRRSSRWSPVTATDVLLPFDKKPVLQDINLVLKPGRTYVVLGPPESGKTSLLKAIAGRLPGNSNLSAKPSKERPHQEGRIEYNRISVTDDRGSCLVVPNVASFVGQLDVHAPYLTVKETFDFAFQSRTGGKHKNIGIDSEHMAADFDQQKFTENLTIEGLDLSGCANTFVGSTYNRFLSKIRELPLLIS